MEQKCEFCRFWKKFGKPKDGECHRSAPLPSTQGNDKTLWPMTHIDQWCGEFQKKECD